MAKDGRYLFGLCAKHLFDLKTAQVGEAYLVVEEDQCEECTRK